MARRHIRKSDSCEWWGTPCLLSSHVTPFFVGRAAPARTLLSSLLLTVTLAACTIVRVSDGSGVRTKYYPGLAVIQITPTDSVQVVEVESLGAAVVGNQASLGWSHNRVALVPPGRCQLIAWRATDEQLEGLRALFGPGSEICSSEGGTR